MGLIIRYLEHLMEASCQEAQSHLRMSMLSRVVVRPLSYPLRARIVELVRFNIIGAIPDSVQNSNIQKS